MNADQQHFVVAFKSDKMGSGDDQLGSLLIKAYINTLVENDNKPAALVFYNAGVLLAAEDSDTAPALQVLEEQGVELLLCGTCVEFFDLKQRLAAGTISNMYAISETLSSTGHVIYP